MHWLDLSGKKIPGKLQSFSQTHPLLPQLLLLSGILHWLDLVLLSLRHCHPTETLVVETLLHVRNLVLSCLLGFGMHQLYSPRTLAWSTGAGKPAMCLP